MMEYRNLDLTLISASGLKEVNKFRKINVYAEAKIKGYVKSKKRTKPDKNCGINPTWNHQMRFVVDEPSLKPAPPGCGLALVVKLKANLVVGPDKLMGQVYVPIPQLFEDCGKTAGVERTIDFEVRKLSGKLRGNMKISYVFGEKYRRIDVKLDNLTKTASLKETGQSSSSVPTTTTTTTTTNPLATPGMATYPHHHSYQEPFSPGKYPPHQYSPPRSVTVYSPRSGGGDTVFKLAK